MYLALDSVARRIKKFRQMVFAFAGRNFARNTPIIRPRRSREAERAIVIKLSRERSVGRSVGQSVGLSVHCIVEKRQIGSGCRLAS